MSLPTDLLYTADHEWLRLVGSSATVGITSFAADALGDVVFVELPTVGTRVRAGQPCGEVESTKSVSDILAPADGLVTSVNEALLADCSLVNADPQGQGWLFRLVLDETPDLLDAAAYAALVDSG